MEVINEWWESRKRKREVARQTPSEAMEAQRRKGNELIGEMFTKRKDQPVEEKGTATLIIFLTVETGQWSGSN
jgi:hypothetical protein